MNARDIPVRFSNLKRMALSPAHYLAALTQPREQTPAMLFGELVHALVLGGNVAVYDGERRGNAWKDFKAANEGATIVTVKEHDKARRVADSVLSHSLARELLEGEHEKPIAWKIGNRDCSSRLDVLGRSWVTDLKTCNTAQPEMFMRAALRMGYHAQLTFYQDAAQYIGRACPSAFIVAVEVNPPFPVVCWKLSHRAMQNGQKLARLWWERLMACEESGVWPGYAQSLLDLDIEDEVPLMIDGEEVAA